MLLVKALILAAITFGFFNIWVNYYPDAMLHKNGNYLVICAFIFMLGVFSSNFGAFKIGVYRIHEIVYYFTIALLFTDVFTFVELCLIARHILDPIPLIIGLIYQFVVIAFGSYFATYVYFQLYKPRRMLALFSDEEGFKLISKMQHLPRRFNIEQGVNVNTTSLKEIKHLIDKYECVIICNVDNKIENEIFLYCYANQKRTYLLPSIVDMVISNSYEIQISDVPVLMNRNRGLTDEQRIIKRIMDIVISGLMLIVASPIMAVIAIAVKLQDGGHVFYKQNRVTRDGRIFNVLKFRSMIEDSDKGPGVTITESNDSRITKVGKIIRTLRVDELPQLINVLKGDMSMVGPRPESVSNVYTYSEAYPEFDLRHRVKGGITGYAQIYGKHNTSPKDKVNMDIYYIETYSPLLDIKLMALTLKTMFTSSSNEGFEQQQQEKK